MYTGGTTLGWGGSQAGTAPAVHVTDGGPSGVGDGYLLLSTIGYHLAARNIAQWTGDYIAAGITTIEMDLDPDGDVEIRRLLCLARKSIVPAWKATGRQRGWSNGIDAAQHCERLP